MAVIITVLSGSAAQREFSIEQDVLRIGGDPACEIALPDAGVPPHAATLEQRDDGYVIYNRGGGVLRLESRVIAARGFAPWTSGQTLHVTEAVALRLEVREKAPAARPAPPSGDAGKRPAPAAKTGAPSTNGKRLQQAALLGVVAALILAVVFMDAPTEVSNAAGGQQRRCTELLAAMRQQSRAGDRSADALGQLLQEAYIAEAREDAARARTLYGQVLASLLPRRDARGAFPQALDQQVWDFASSALESVR